MNHMIFPMTVGASIVDKFRFAFIDDDRYKMVLSGLKVTVQISVFSILLGVIIGAILAANKLTDTSYKGGTVLSKAIWLLKCSGKFIANVYIDIIRGTPMALQLMIMYFVIFNGASEPIYAAIIAFGMNSGAYVAEIFRAGILAVDYGQTEAGRSLGLSSWKTMQYIVVPQAIKNVIPALGNEFIVLIKETAIVGLIAIQDLTKAADFIISRTFEAFTPLIGVAVIYFVIIKILAICLQMVERRLRQSDNR